MVNETIFLTEEGYKRMQQELEQANQTLYEELPQKLKHSKLSGGDLRENKEYIYLQSEQQYYEREVRRLTGVLEAAEIIPEDKISGEEIDCTLIYYSEKENNLKFHRLQYIHIFLHFQLLGVPDLIDGVG